MARRPATGSCVHCLQRHELLTWDHGIPVSWFPSGTSAAKIKAPSCRPCQERLAKVERAVLLPLALCLDPNDPRTRGVPQAVMRSIDPALAGKPGMTPEQIARDRRARERLRDEVGSRLFQPELQHFLHALPGFGANEAQGGNTAILGPRDTELQIFGGKVVRIALWCMRDKQLVFPDCTIKTHVVKMETVRNVEALVRSGDALDMFPGIRVTLRTASDNTRAHLCLLEIWARLRLFVSVVPGLVSEGGPPKESP